MGEVGLMAESLRARIRSKAVELVDARHGYTYEFSSSPEAHLQEYDEEERRLLAKVRLTKPQQALLDELRETGGLYIKKYGRYGRTARALVDKGRAHITEHDYSSFSQDRYEALEDLD